MAILFFETLMCFQNRFSLSFSQRYNKQSMPCLICITG